MSEMEYRIVQYERGTDFYRNVGASFADLKSARIAAGGEDYAQGEGREPWIIEHHDAEDGWYMLSVEDVLSEDVEPEEVACYLAERHGWTPEMIEEKLG